jgi:hypothetical protein
MKTNHSADTWKRVAIKLEEALRRTPYQECHELDHRGGHFHGNNEECPVVKMCKEALELFDATIDAEKLKKRM